MRRAFGEVIVKLGQHDPRIVVATCDVHQEMEKFKEEFPERFYDFGLTEQASMSIVAGMAIAGLRPIFYTLTPFLVERAYEQIKIDIDEQRLPVMLVGNSDYPTHGITHRPRDIQTLAKTFKHMNVQFPESRAQAIKAMLDAYKMEEPSLICLHNDVDKLPFL